MAVLASSIAESRVSRAVADTGTYGQFVNNLCFDQGRVHVKANQATHSAIHIIELEREIHLQFTGQTQVGQLANK